MEYNTKCISKFLDTNLYHLLFQIRFAKFISTRDQYCFISSKQNKINISSPLTKNSVKSQAKSQLLGLH